MDEIYSDIGTDKNYRWTEPDAETKGRSTTTEKELPDGNQNRMNRWELVGLVLVAAVTVAAYSVW